MVFTHKWKQASVCCLVWGVKSLNSQVKKLVNYAHIKLEPNRNSVIYPNMQEADMAGGFVNQ
jgi:hypothetical protein